jgi:hypothetical protein
LVFLLGLDAEDSRIASRTCCVALCEVVKEDGYDDLGLLSCTFTGQFAAPLLWQLCPSTYKDFALGLCFAFWRAAFRECDELFRPSLGFFRFVPCGIY